MKNKTVKFAIFGIALLGALGIAYGASRKYRNRNKVSNDTVYIRACLKTIEMMNF